MNKSANSGKQRAEQFKVSAGYAPNETSVLQNLDPYMSCQHRLMPVKHYEKPTFTYETKTPRQQQKGLDKVSNPEGSVKNSDGSCSHKASNRLRTGTSSTKANHVRTPKDTFDVALVLSVGLLQRL